MIWLEEELLGEKNRIIYLYNNKVDKAKSGGANDESKTIS